ncbi:hypothetical protein PFLA_a3596 [Pseudoalteromonas flavipulchra NCIMB 2033 = ATCC BAA-314]|nr:hypothetical protein [Pseudoalteromonas flavipulchra NCIMB 2033 = ATCC BAA-314]
MLASAYLPKKEIAACYSDSGKAKISASVCTGFGVKRE